MDGQVLACTIRTTPEVGKNTGNPLVIKGVERIESIILPGDDIRLDAELYSHVLSRVMRRDFNYTSAKLFWYTKGFHRRLHARSMLHDLAGEAERLDDMARPYDMPEGAPAATCTMRIVSDEAELLFHALVKADRALHKLMHSPLAEVAEENMGPFLRAFSLLRKQVFGFNDNQRQSASCHSRIAG
ncbi:hypothetical protein [Janthinobacterium sp. TND4EL3]|uniref:hypothetical protein n=1 Tax=Janthinobacterium sp. TND4EL3 TaxID=1907311 RepID=UPI0009708BCE|nr:hypothetical protein [Janthinobacterium sp. TND4EL3]